MEKIKVNPLGGNVLIKPLKMEKMTDKGIYLPETASEERPQEGGVIAVGPGKLTKDGKRTSLEVHAGQKVIFKKYSGTEIKIDGEEYLIVEAEDILAIVE